MKLPRLLKKMERDWNSRARKNTRYYIATMRTDWTQEDFLNSGRVTIEQHILNDMSNICADRDPKKMRVLEVGCGAGRLTKAPAEVFGEVHGVDVSGGMIDAARTFLKAQSNALVYQNNGMDLTVLPDLRFDFAFSYLVFQHIPSSEIIESYLSEVSRRLLPGSLFKCQVNGCLGKPRRLSWLSARNTWFGVALSEEQVVDLAERSGFEARHMIGAGTQEFWLWLFKRPN